MCLYPPRVYKQKLDFFMTKKNNYLKLDEYSSLVMEFNKGKP